MRVLKMWFVIPLMVASLLLSASPAVYASSYNAVYSYQNATSTYNANSLKEIEGIVRDTMAKREQTVVIKYKGQTAKLLNTVSGYISKAIAADEYLNYSYRSVHMSYKAYGTNVTITLQFKYYETVEEMNQVNKKVQSILAQIINPAMNDHEKVKAVHDYLVLNLAYDKRLVNNSPYPALSEGITACNGYAMLVYKMLKELGIEVRLISGVASSQSFKTQNHAWNMVKLDGNWYHLDATWDDPVPDEKGRVLYDYYLLTDQEISTNHSWKSGGINGDEKPYPRAATSYFKALQTKLSKTNEADRYMKLINSIDLQYLLPQYTANSLKELQAMIKKGFSDYRTEFTIRYIDTKGNLNTNLRQLIYDIAAQQDVKSWSFSSNDFVRGESPNDQAITISDINYYQSQPKKPVQTKIQYPTPGYTSMGSFVNVKENKAWTIQLSGEVDQSSISDENIYVLNSSGEKVTSVEVSIQDPNQIIVKNKAGYNTGETYYLYVNNALESVYKEPLNESVSIKFTIAL